MWSLDLGLRHIFLGDNIQSITLSFLPFCLSCPLFLPPSPPSIIPSSLRCWFSRYVEMWRGSWLYKSGVQGRTPNLVPAADRSVSVFSSSIGGKGAHVLGPWIGLICTTRGTLCIVLLHTIFVVTTDGAWLMSHHWIMKFNLWGAMPWAQVPSQSVPLHKSIHVSPSNSLLPFS